MVEDMIDASVGFWCEVSIYKFQKHVPTFFQDLWHNPFVKCEIYLKRKEETLINMKYKSGYKYTDQA